MQIFYTKFWPNQTFSYAHKHSMPFTALIFIKLTNVQWHYMEDRLPNFKPSAKQYGNYRQIFVYALQESMNVTQTIFMTLKVAPQRCKEL
jgi:hypothetical protein